jgi:glucose/arabinose dehydrogenase
MTALPGADHAYIATKDGRVWVYDGEAVLDVPALDISGNVHNQGERGLLSIVIHPEDSSRFFAHYTALGGDTVVSEFAFRSESEIDPGSERVLLRHAQPAANHNGGMILFGPDDALFLGLGDGGGANDRFDNSQNRDTLLGGLVRIDVDAADTGAELFQYGLRNPWRFWFDEGLVYIADVGQRAFEEVSVAPIEPDVNYGWPITEAKHCFRPASGCDSTGLTLPVIEVSHGDAGTCSITGGIVYRGPAIPEIDGHFFYSDYCGGYLRSFRYEDGAVVEESDWTDQVGEAGRVVGFGMDGAGEMYVATTERLLKVVAERG